MGKVRVCGGPPYVRSSLTRALPLPLESIYSAFHF